MYCLIVMSVNILVYDKLVFVWLIVIIYLDIFFLFLDVCNVEFVNYMFLLVKYYFILRLIFFVFCRWGYSLVLELFVLI